MSIPRSNCQALGQPVLLQGILKGRSSGQVVPAGARALPKNSPSRACWSQMARLLAGFAKFVTRPHLAVLISRQANKLGDELLGQGRMTLIRKLADREDGRLLSQKNPSCPSQNLGSFYTEEGRGWGPVQC